MNATHLVKLWFYVSEPNVTKEQVRERIIGRFKPILGDSLENVEIIESN